MQLHSAGSLLDGELGKSSLEKDETFVSRRIKGLRLYCTCKLTSLPHQFSNFKIMCNSFNFTFFHVVKQEIFSIIQAFPQKLNNQRERRRGREERRERETEEKEKGRKERKEEDRREKK